MKKKFALMATSLVLVAALAVGGTLAWLTAQTESITNTFTVGNVNISLTESEDLDLKMVPGQPIDKDPTVTVTANSEDSWVFVKIEESTNLGTFIDYDVASEWTALTGVTGVYYREYTSATTDTGYSVIGYTNEANTFVANKVLVNDTVTKTDMDGLTQSTYPTLTFTAYAIQKDGFNTANEAWNATFGAPTTTTP